MNLEEYKKEVLIELPDSVLKQKLLYATIGLTAEAGEVAGKVQKMIRDNNSEMTQEIQQQLKKEMGDVMWFLGLLSDAIDVDLNEVVQENIIKIKNRVKNNTIGGSGDER